MSYLFISIHNNDVRTDLPDILIANLIIRFITEQTAEFTIAAHNQFKNLTRTLIKFKIRYPAKFLAVFQIDDFFFLEFRKQHIIPDITPFLLFNAKAEKSFLINGSILSKNISYTAVFKQNNIPFAIFRRSHILIRFARFGVLNNIRSLRTRIITHIDLITANNR